MSDYDISIQWARWQLARSDWLILDSETTGLGPDAEIVQISILHPDGTALCNRSLKPSQPIPAAATAIHGITDAMVAHAPTFADIVPALGRVLHGKTVVIYNAAFDCRMLAQELYRLWNDRDKVHDWLDCCIWECAMERYAAFVGEWNRYHRNYRWQPLPGGDHTALGDCRATLDLIKRMAAARLSTEVQG